uniref:Uncharacterized protein n=1 Tax=Micrurus spixii TaxID=129469 RepID=A0A2D4M6M7_9SAUR
MIPFTDKMSTGRWDLSAEASAGQKIKMAAMLVQSKLYFLSLLHVKIGRDLPAWISVATILTFFLSYAADILDQICNPWVQDLKAINLNVMYLYTYTNIMFQFSKQFKMFLTV